MASAPATAFLNPSAVELAALAVRAGVCGWLAGNGGCPRPAVDHVRALFERGGEALECGIEHRPHQHRQHPAAKFIGEVETDVAVGLGSRLEGPAVFQIAERALQV